METLQDLGKEYQRRFASLAPYRGAVWRVLVRDFFQRYVDPRATVLDLGSGWGEFIGNIHAQRRIAMDLNPDMPSRVGSGVETILQDCSQPWQVADSSLDLVFTSNFFEHLPDKDALRRTLHEALRCLKEGGRIICLGPNIRFLNGPYWDFWDHFLPLTDRSMVEILTLTGFAVERIEPRFLPYSMSQGFTPPIGLIALYLRIPLLWRILGKQFLVVGRTRRPRFTPLIVSDHRAARLSIFVTLCQDFPVRVAGDFIGFAGLFLFTLSNGGLFLRPALVDRLQAPLGRFSRSPDRLAAN
jgi:SAM-dependent methyltransferase